MPVRWPSKLAGRLIRRERFLPKSKKTLVALAILVGALILLDPIFDLIPWTAGDLRAELLWRFPPREDSSSSLLLAEGPFPAGGHSLSMAIPLAHIAVAAGVVYAGSFDGRLYALEAVSGKPLWSVQVGVMRSAPTVAERVLYVGSSNQQYGYVRAFDAATGERLWRYWVVAGFDRMVGGFVDTPTVADGVVYVSSGEGHVYALDAAGGELLWYFRTGEGWTDAPMVADGVVYIASSNGVVYALRPAAVE